MALSSVSGFDLVSTRNNRGRMMQPCMSRPSSTVTIYKPICCTRTAKSSTSRSFPATIDAIPTGEYLQSGVLYNYDTASALLNTVMVVYASVVNSRRACAARVTGVCVCVCVSVQSNLRSCANTRATRNTYGFSVTRIVK